MPTFELGRQTMSTGEEKKKTGLSINMATAKREELVDFIHACSERIRVSKQKIMELQGDLKTQTEERELAELRANVWCDAWMGSRLGP